jgi:hypothetical protein
VYFVDSIPPGVLYEAADGRPTRADVKFHGTPHVGKRMLVQFQLAIFFAIHNAAANAESRVIGELMEAPFEVIGLQPYIAIKFDDEVPIVTLKTLVAGIECLHNTGAGYSPAAVCAMNRNDPGVLFGILVNKRSGVIMRTIIDDNPLGGVDRLTYDGLKSPTDILGLIPDWRDDDILPRDLSKRFSRLTYKGIFGTSDDGYG